MTIKEIENNIAVCGLVCTFCSCKSNCSGCRSKDEDCSIKKCSSEKGLDYCFLCEEFPCDEGMFKNIRLKAFNMVAKEEGLHKLAEYLVRNYQNGIQYHRSNGLKGDYDKRQSEEEVISLLKNGRPDPYDVCPTYESKTFYIRLISADDAEDLFEVYNNKEAKRFFDSVNCNFGYDNDNLEKMQTNVKLWLDSYFHKSLVRFSIIDKLVGKVVGTIEMFSQSGRGILRIDILPEYENKINIEELLYMSNNFFYDFQCDMIVTKAIPEATKRINALLESGYTPYPKNYTWDRENYFMKALNRENIE